MLNMERPIRKLIQIINNTPIYALRQLDPNFPKLLKTFIKAPMVVILAISGLMVGITMTCVKFSGELVADGSFEDDPVLIVVFVSIAIFDSLFLIFSVNLCMKYYD